MNLLKPILRISPVSLLLCLAMVAVLGLNASFSTVALGHIRLLEYLAIGATLMCVAGAVFHSRSRAFLWGQRTAHNVLLVALVLVGLLYLILGGGSLPFSLHQSFMVLSASLGLMFSLFFENDRFLKRFLLSTLVAFSVIISVKLLVFLFLGLTHADEAYRVRHDEVDVLFASLALIGLVLFSKEFLAKSKILFWCLIVLNSVVLFLTFKRSAVLGLIVALVLFLIITRDKRKTLIVLGLAAGFVIAGFGLLFVLDREIFSQIFTVIANKFDLLHEKNIVWRTTAWSLAWDKFLAAPLFGQGFGQRILDAPISGNPNFFPHNSFLSILVSTGLAGFAVFAAVIVSAFLGLWKLYRSHENKKLVLFFLLGLVYLLVFAFFNYSLEDQGEALLFWFFVASPAFLAKTESDQAGRSHGIQHGFALAGLIGLAVLALLPPVYEKTVFVYDPKTKGVLPDLWDAKPAERVVNANNGFTIEMEGQHGAVTNLFWTLPAEVFASVNGRESDFFLIFDLEEPLEFGPSIIFRNNDGTTQELSNLLPRSDKIVVPVGPLMGGTARWLSDYYGFSLHFFNGDTPQTVGIRNVRFEEKKDPFVKWRIYSPAVLSLPKLSQDVQDGSLQVTVTGAATTIRSKTVQDTWSTVSWEISSYVLNNVDRSRYDVVFRLAQPVGMAPFSYALPDNQENFSYRNFLVKEMTFPLEDLRSSTGENPELTLNIPYEAHDLEWSIESISLERRAGTEQ